MKKFLSALLASVTVLSCAAASFAVDAPLPCVTENAGDANGDSVVNAKDVTALMKYCAGSAELAAPDPADVNRDGAVNAKDVAVLLKYLAGFDVFPGHGDVQITESDEGRTVVCADCGAVIEGKVDPGKSPDEPPAERAEPNVFYITDFGAVSDGKTDCTEAIQAAFEEARKVGGKVIIPPGSYLTGYLNVGSGISVEGTPGWSFGANGRSTLVLNDAKAKCLLDVTAAWQCSIKGVCLAGGYLGENVHGIYSYNKSDFGGNPVIDDCRIEHFTGDGIHYERQGCFKILHSMMYENRGAGLYLFGCDGFILDNWLTGNLNCGMYGANASALTVTANRVEWNGIAGIKLDCGDTASFTGNSFDRNNGPAIWLGTEEWLYTGVSVSGNVFRRNGRPNNMTFESPYENSHLYFEKVSNAAVTGNTFILGRDDGDTGIYSPDYCIFLDLCDAVTVQGNAMKNGAMKESIIWDGWGECIFEGNTGVTGIRKQAVSDWDDFE